MDLWNLIMHHATVLRIGSDGLMAIGAIEANNPTMFAASFVALVKDIAHEAKVKEITPEMMLALQPHIEGMATVLMAAAAK